MSWDSDQTAEDAAQCSVWAARTGARIKPRDKGPAAGHCHTTLTSSDDMSLSYNVHSQTFLRKTETAKP